MFFYKGLRIETFNNKTYQVRYIAHYLNGKLHRIDGPALEYSNGTKMWYYEGKQHRINGPAVLELIRTT